MRFYVAAEGSRWLGSKGTRVGRRLPSARGARVPTGESHAVPTDGDSTLCGLPVHELTPFGSTDFETASMHQLCRTCQAAASDRPA